MTRTRLRNAVALLLHVPTLSGVHKIILVLLSGLLLSTNLASAALSAKTAQTAQTVQGTKPYLSVSHINDINAGKDFSLLGVKFDSNSYFTVTDIYTKLSSLSLSLGELKPTELAQKLGTGTGTISAAYKTPIITTDANDDDGDGFINSSLSGSATVGWYYLNGSTETTLTGIYLNKTFCELAVSGISPYLKIAGPVTLSSQYGDPLSQVYNAADSTSPLHSSQGGGGKNPIRHFYPGGAMVCYASPTMQYAKGGYDPNQPTKFNPNYGFLPQQNSHDNFPHSGAKGLYFYLIVTGIDANASSWSVTTTDTAIDNPTANPPTKPITAVVTKSAEPGALGLPMFLQYKANTMVLVTLSGPDKTDTTATAKAAKANLPVTLTITGNDGTNTVNYAFTLDKWFINRSGVAVPVTDYNGSFTDNQRDWCAGLNGSNYILPSVKDLTNAVTTGWTSGSSSGNFYQRVVGDGLLSEWGSMYLFSGSNFPSALFVTRDMYVGGPQYFRVNGALGTIGTTQPFTSNYAVCVSQ